MSSGRTGWKVAQLALLTFAVSCASAPPATPPKVSVRLEPTAGSPAPAASTSAPAALPALPTLTGSISEGSGPRLKSLNAVDQDITVVIRELASQFGLQYHIDPGVHGRVNARLHNTTLTEALNSIVPQGVTYQIQNGVLRVGAARVETKIFTLDYVALSRVGTASTIIQRRLGGSALGGGGGANALATAAQQTGGLSGGTAGGGADVITAVSVANAWEEIRVAVEALVFDSRDDLAGGQGGGSQTGMQSAGGRPFSRTSADGRRLIINPIAGTITVSAFPQQLTQIEAFIKTFEASIQRQVLIEAKIVEVNLDESFEFGIDWNVVTNFGTASATARSGTPGTTRNIEFTLGGGPGQINAVLTALSSQGNVRVLSSPRVSALNNQRAVFDVTTGEIVFNVSQTPVFGPTGAIVARETQVTPTQVNVGIVLDVLPQIGADNTVTMNIRPVVTSVRSTATFTGPDGTVLTAPVIDTRESDTMARLRAGETIIIGGLMQNRSERVRSGVPGLRSIPLLGRLFTSYKNVERRAELVIFLTPTIIAGQPPTAR